MPLTDDFNQNDYKAQKINGFVLGVSYSNGGGSSIYLAYDFMARVMVTRTGSSDGGTVVTPFSELDRGALISMRDELTRLGGNPPELPPETPASAAPQRKLNL
jgi:hypothetical protein